MDRINCHVHVKISLSLVLLFCVLLEDRKKRQTYDLMFCLYTFVFGGQNMMLQDGMNWHCDFVSFVHFQVVFVDKMLRQVNGNWFCVYRLYKKRQNYSTAILSLDIITFCPLWYFGNGFCDRISVKWTE